VDGAGAVGDEDEVVSAEGVPGVEAGEPADPGVDAEPPQPASVKANPAAAAAMARVPPVLLIPATSSFPGPK